MISAGYEAQNSENGNRLSLRYLRKTNEEFTDPQNQIHNCIPWKLIPKLDEYPER